ncbi:MAG: LysR family transcriptional regulator [Planctomycetota bacterium]
MELEQLRQFVTVAEHGNFTRAAAAIGMSQPALSRSIARLEGALGQPVFERQTRRVSLTDAGQLLLARARQILGIVEDTKAEINDDGESGRIRLGAIPTIAPFTLPKLLHNFTTSAPRATVMVQEDTTNNLLKRCTEGDLDLALVALPIRAKYLETEPLFEEELHLVLAPHHPLTKRRQIGWKDIKDLPFVLLDEAHCLSDNIETLCRQRAFSPISVERTSQLATVQELVSLDHGISMVPAMARALDHSDRRVYRSLSGAKPSRQIAMVWNPYRFQSQLLENFKQHVRQLGA